MDPRAVLHPVGPLPPRIYWLRRLVPLAVLLVLIVVIAVSCSGGGGAPAAGRSPVAAHSAGPTASPSTPASVPRCSTTDLTVTAATDASTYAAGVLPRLTVQIRNGSDKPCAVNDAASTRKWTIVSGTDQVWTTGCTTGRHVTRRVLAPGASARHTLVWNRHRAGSDCAASDVTADPGTYQLIVTANGVRSAAAVFHLTG